MLAVTWHGPADLRIDEVPEPRIQDPADAIVQVTTAAICGSDLHLWHGKIPGMRVGSPIGHEYVGVVIDTGHDVTGVAVGDRVLGSFMIPCGTCWACRASDFGRCPTHRVLGFGAYTGDLDGAQAEQVRVPHASLALRRLDGDLGGLSDAAVLPAGDVLTTGWDCAVEGHIRAGDTVVVQGLGPVGLCAVRAAQHLGAAHVHGVDPDPARRARAEKLGASAIDPTGDHPATVLLAATAGRGADVVLDCVGSLPALEQALSTVRPGGRVSCIGILAEPAWTTAVNVHFARGIEVKFCGTANVIGRWDETLRLVGSGTFDTEGLVTHRLPLRDALTGYQELLTGKAMKVLLIP